jgi:SnoaL-like domain
VPPAGQDRGTLAAMTTSPIPTWHRLVSNRDASGLDEILAEDVVFHSPVVHTPLVGRELARKYLSAAFEVFFDDSFRYVWEVVGPGEAVLEFVVQLQGIEVNGVDMIRWRPDGKIVSFKVMLRPLKAIHLVHEKMAAALQREIPRD